jgi:polysaccharide export outer membrane protein
VGKFVRKYGAHDKTSTLATVFAVALLLALSAAACPAAHAQVSADKQQVSRLGVGDWVSIQVSGQPDATSYIGGDGTINVPLVGNIPVAGISPVEAGDRVARALKDGGYFVDPHVTVLATQPQGQSVSVVGEVATQGRYPITPRTTIVDLLAQAGGVKETASDVGYVLHSDDTGHVTRHPVSLNALTGSKGAPPAWTLLAGDSLVVPPAEHFSVIGAVTTPGRYRIEPQMTVIQAIARAGGITERGSERRIQLQRADKPGEYKTIHAKPGDLVKADDIIRVKESLF